MNDALWLNFRDPQSAESAALRDWWSKLKDSPGPRAELRRCREPAQAVFCPAYHHLRLKLAPLGQVRRDRLEAIAALLAHVREDEPGAPLAAQMARRQEGGENARVSGLRFRRLIAHDTVEDLFPALVRVIRQLDGRTNVIDLALVVMNWNTNTRKNLAYAYYDQAPAKEA